MKKRFLQGLWRPLLFIKKWPQVLLVFIIGALAGCTTMAVQEEALGALQSDTQVRVKQERFWVFEPVLPHQSPGLVIYPGAKVDPRSYAPVARGLAERGYLVAIVPVALSFAIFSPNRADWVRKAYPDVPYWVVAGHSLGGVAAAQYAQSHTDRVKGIVFWASYPASDISSSGIPVVSISASLDGLATPEKIEKYKKNQPPETEYVVIPGGNHAQFGWYGPQKGDKKATISAEEQTQKIIDATAGFLEKLEQILRLPN